MVRVRDAELRYDQVTQEATESPLNKAESLYTGAETVSEKDKGLFGAKKCGVKSQRGNALPRVPDRPLPMLPTRCPRPIARESPP